jgi:type I restriction enzyme R subunit
MERVRASAFAGFGDERGTLVGGGRPQVVFALPDEVIEASLHGELTADDFDLVLVDECWASGDDAWMRALDGLEQSVWIGLSVTSPDAGDGVEARFGSPLAVYETRHAIEDGLLAPYVLRHVPAVVEDSDVDKALSAPETTNAMARYLLAYLRRTDPFAKTIVACVDGAHAERMQAALVARAEELGLPREGYAFVLDGEEGVDLDRFRDVDQPAPVLALVAGTLPDLALPAVKNVALCRGVTSPAEYTRVLARAARLRPDCDKWYFSVLDFAATETTNTGIADLETIGEPDSFLVQSIGDDPEPAPFLQRPADDEPETTSPREAFGAMLNLESAGQILKNTLGQPGDLRALWARPEGRREVLERLDGIGVDLGTLAERSGRPDADGLDLLVHTVCGTPIWSRSERAEALQSVLEHEEPRVRAVLAGALAQYVAHGLDEPELPAILGRRALRELGGVVATEPFENAEGLKNALRTLQQHLYGHRYERDRP